MGRGEAKGGEKLGKVEGDICPGAAELLVVPLPDTEQSPLWHQSVMLSAAEAGLRPHPGVAALPP